MRTASLNHTVSNAESLAMTLGDPDRADQDFRLNIFRTMPRRFIKPIGHQYQQIYTQLGRREANLMLLNIKSKLTGQIVRLSSSDDEIVLFAKRRAEACRRVLIRLSCLNDAYRSISSIVKRFGLKPVNIGGKYSLYGAVIRMADERWWRRTIRKTHGRNSEALAIQFGLVRKQTGIYASDEALSRRTEQRTRTSQMLEEIEAVNELDQSYTLKELQELTVSNPAIRRAELMTRIAGFEEYALKNGHVGEFTTITCPSRMHSHMSKSGDLNPKYDGTTPEKAQKYLTEQWNKIRAALKRAGIELYGMRVAEPQHDGTPHWHMLVFMEPEHVDTVLEIMSHYALEVDGDEKGASNHRFTSKSIDWSKGSAAGYIAKYIAKNIDGYGVGDDLYGNDATRSSLRVDAWASTWGIRQFQQVGGPPVTIWRILRQLSEIPEDGIVSLAHEAADQGAWCQYMEIMGGHTVLRKDWPIGLAKQDIDALNIYGEPIGQAIVGISVGQLTYRSKNHTWTIRLKPESNIVHTEIDSVNLTLRNVKGTDKIYEVDELYVDDDQSTGVNIPIGSGFGLESFETSSGTGPEGSETELENFENRFRTDFDPLEFCQ